MSEGRCVIAKNFMIIYVENLSHLIIIFIKIVTDFFFFFYFTLAVLVVGTVKMR